MNKNPIQSNLPEFGQSSMTSERLYQHPEPKQSCVNNTDDEDRKVAYETLNTGWVMWLRAKRDAKAQSVPKVINVGNELQSWVAVWSFKARHDHEDYIVVDANLLAEKIEKLTGANA